MSDAVLVHKTPVYRVVRLAVLVAARVLFRCRIRGREHVPAEGPVVLAANHQSMIDIPLIAQAVHRHVCFVARDNLAERGWLAGLMRQCGAVLIQRGKPDRAALRAMGEHLELGDCVAVFPEGTRSEDGRVRPFRGGAVLAARKSGAPIVPVAIEGSGAAWPRGSRLPRLRRVSVTFAAPVPGGDEGALDEVERRVRVLVEPSGSPHAAESPHAAQPTTTPSSDPHGDGTEGLTRSR